MIYRLRVILMALSLSCSMMPSIVLAGLVEGKAAYKKKDFATALREYRLLAAQGDAEAQFRLGVMYFIGQGILDDYKEAIKWYRLAAGQGHANAQNNLGGMYADGRGVPKDYKEAIKWYRLAAGQGVADAQNNLGEMYENGQSVASNRVAAYALYNLSASIDPSDTNPATANRARLSKLMSNMGIEAAQNLTREIARPGNLLKALDKYANNQND